MGCNQDQAARDDILLSKCNGELGMSLNPIKSNSALLSQPGFQYGEGGFSIVNTDTEANWDYPGVLSAPTAIDEYFSKTKNYPNHVTEYCDDSKQTKTISRKCNTLRFRVNKRYGSVEICLEKEKRRCLMRTVTLRYDHTHLGMSSAIYNKGILIGAPHKLRTTMKGEVAFYEMVNSIPNKYESWSLSSTDFDETRVGMGDLFGWSISTSDFNKDGIDDAVIGSPGYSTDWSVNKGRAFVLIGDSSSNFNNKIILENPSDTSRAFGYTVNTMDLNKDGYVDVVVSAPFGEDGGKIFIFNGNPKGLMSSPSQEIGREQRESPITGPDWFGFSTEMSNSLLLVGSPYVDRVEAFKLKPSVKVELSTKLLPNEPIEFENRKIKYQICAAYRGTSVDPTDTPSKLEFVINADYDPIHGRSSLNQGHQSDVIELNNQKEKCATFGFTIQDKPYYR